MSSTTDRVQSPPSRRKLSKKWLVNILIVALVVVIALAYMSYTPVRGSLLVKPGLSPSPSREAVSLLPATNTLQPSAAPTSTPEPTSTPTPTATQTSIPTATSTQTPSATPGVLISVFVDAVNLRSGPSVNYVKLDKLAFGDQLELLGRTDDSSWFNVRTMTGQEGWISAQWVNLGRVSAYKQPIKTQPPTETSTRVVLTDVEGHWIDIDLSEQTLRAYDGTQLMASFLVSTGTDLYPTEMGQFTIDIKYRYSDMRGSDYFLPDVPFVMYYYEEYAIHGTYWHHNFGTRMTHGCVNMDTSDAEWLFNFSEVGTLVNIHR